MLGSIYPIYQAVTVNGWPHKQSVLHEDVKKNTQHNLNHKSFFKDIH